jgi:hypothetical protein
MPRAVERHSLGTLQKHEVLQRAFSPKGTSVTFTPAG